ncbi:MAG: acetate--CoA ligase [Dehalococcoidia bacterium]|nr:acetate--CoA ligase [Dehalococcoidia bacterium]
MNYQPIVKPAPDRMPVRPNLIDYAAARASFRWDGIRAELDGLPGGGLNIAHECIDRHLKTHRREKTAMLWEGKDGRAETYTFAQMAAASNKAANALRSLGVQKGDRVFVFLERVPELYFAVFGALKLGAVIGPLFSAFGPDAVRDRLADSGAKVLLTSPELWARVKEIRSGLPELRHVVILDRRGGAAPEGAVAWADVFDGQPDAFEIERTDPEDFAIMHYTSGTTGKPKGAAHVHMAVMGHYATARDVLDLHDEDVYWCTADPGWVTGTSYGMFGPWSNGATSLVYEGGFAAGHWYSLIEKYGVTVWYTAPTAIRMLMKAGEELPKKHGLSSLRYVCSVGEPLNPEGVLWGQKVFGLPIHDNWWQTETGAILIANYPAQDIRPGSMGRPFPGIEPAIIDDDGNEAPTGEEGNLAVRPGWPSMFRTYWNNRELYESRFRNGWYITGDRARRDADGYFWFVGRADDVINTAGHLVGPFEVESALIEHPAVAEAGVIGKPDPVAMEVVKAFVALKDGYEANDKLRRELIRFSREKLGAGTAPREIEFLPSLPKTRSGKIMRRLLKARELGLPEGDTSTLEED